MKQKRRDFIKYAGLTGLAITGGGAGAIPLSANLSKKSNFMTSDPDTYSQPIDTTAQGNKTLIGPYGTLADTLLDVQYVRGDERAIDAVPRLCGSRLNSALRSGRSEPL